MKKIGRNNTILTDAEVDEMVQLLEVVHAETGNMNVFRIMEIIMRETIESIKIEVNGKNNFGQDGIGFPS